MRIYSASYIPRFYKDYVGKDIWVECMLYGYHEAYVRFLKYIPESSTFIINRVYSEDIGSPQAAKIAPKSYGYRMDCITILDTFGEHALTTEEVLGGLQGTSGSDSKNILRFAKKPLWFRGTLSGNVHYYIHITQYEDNWVKCDMINAKYIDNFEDITEEYLYNEETPPSWRMHKHQVVAADVVTIDPGPEVYSDEEISEILQVNDKLFDDLYLAEFGRLDYGNHSEE